jgi:hypothetical protein
MQSGTLQSISLSHTKFTSNGLARLAERFPKLKSVDAHQTVCDKRAAVALLGLDSLTLLQVSEYSFGDDTEYTWTVIAGIYDKKNARKQSLQLVAEKRESIPDDIRKRQEAQFESVRKRANDLGR